MTKDCRASYQDIRSYFNDLVCRRWTDPPIDRQVSHRTSRVEHRPDPRNLCHARLNELLSPEARIY